MIERVREQFRATVWNYYERQGRHELPWRVKVTPYGVLVSEIMLQQTQVSRVLGRWERWLERWPE
jgi:A/G-specific adenine glycosylase